MAKPKKGKMPPALKKYWAEHRRKKPKEGSKAEERGESKATEARERRTGKESKKRKASSKRSHETRMGKSVGKITAAKRRRVPKSEMGLPNAKRSSGVKGKYPMPDRSHAANAKARAKQQLDKGNLSKAQYNKIVAKANRILGEKGRRRRAA